MHNINIIYNNKLLEVVFMAVLVVSSYDGKGKVTVHIKGQTDERTVSAIELRNVLESGKADIEFDEMDRLVKELNLAIMEYEQNDNEIMTNFEYDAKYDKLERMEKSTGVVMKDSPTRNVGYDVVSKLQKETHKSPMLSLDKTKDTNVLISWIGDREGVLSWKLDGLTVVLHYNNGKLEKAITRGNGEIGELVTGNAKQFINIPKVINYKGELVLRGEAVISYENFNKINETAQEKYKNPRNLASGSVRQLDSKVTAGRSVEWICFNVEKCEELKGKTVYEQLKSISELGFDVVESIIVTRNNLIQAIDKFKEAIKNYRIPTDGLVITFNDRVYGESLGRTSKFYRHSMAFKWGDEEAETRLKTIEWQVGRTGIITPVAVFEPVELEGTIVERASLHNLSIIEQVLGRPYIGQRVKVIKSNMIIPQITAGDKSVTGVRIGIPENCPCCGSRTIVNTEYKSGVNTLWCTNEDCGAKGNRKLKHFVSRNAMNIDGISEKTLEVLVNKGIVNSFGSLFRISEHKYKIASLDGFGMVSANKMISAVEKARNVKIGNLIFALGIPNIGISTAKLICKTFNNDLNELLCAKYNDIVRIEGIGSVIADSWFEYWCDEDNVNEFRDLMRELTIEKETVSNDKSMRGLSICVTGSVEIFKNRDAVKEAIESRGGKLTGSVSKSTSYLVTNDTTSGSKKNRDAEAYGIDILTERQFIDKFGIEV